MKTPKTPQEIELWYIIPAIKREITKILVKKGYKQNETAKMLSTTKSAVSQYLSAKRARELGFDDYENVLEQIKQAADSIMKGSNASMEIQKIVKQIRQKGFVCGLLKKFGGCVPEECRICMEEK